MAYQNVGVSIGIGGKIFPSLPSAFAQANVGLKRLQSQATATTGAFSRMGRAFFGAIALGGGIAGVAGLTSFMNRAVKLGKEQENVTRNLYVLLQNNAKMHRQGAAVAGEQLRAIQAQSRAMQEQSGIAETIFTKGAAILTTNGLTVKQITRMQPLMANLLAYQTRMGKTAESLPAVYQAIGRAIHLGQVRGLTEAGITLSKIEQMEVTRLAMLGRYDDALNIVIRHMAIFNGQGKSYLKTAQGQAALVQTHTDAWMRLIGKAFIPAQYQLTLIYGKLVELFGPYFIQACKNFTTALQGVNLWLNENRVSIMAAIKDGWQKLCQATDWFIKNANWLLPLLAKLAIAWAAWSFVIAPFLTTISLIVIACGTLAPILGGIGAALLLLDPEVVLVVASIAGLTLGIGYLIDNWKKLWNWMSKGLPDPKGTAPRAELVTLPHTGHGGPGGGGTPMRRDPLAGPQKALENVWIRWMQNLDVGFTKTTTHIGAVWNQWLTNLESGLDKQIFRMEFIFTHWFSNLQKGWDKLVSKISWVWDRWTQNLEQGWARTIEKLKTIFNKWMALLEEGWTKRVNKWWNPMIEGVKSVGVAIWKWLTQPITFLNDQWKKFLGFIGMGGATPNQYGGGAGSTEDTSGKHVNVAAGTKVQPPPAGEDTTASRVWNPIAPNNVTGVNPMKNYIYIPHRSANQAYHNPGGGNIGAVPIEYGATGHGLLKDKDYLGRPIQNPNSYYPTDRQGMAAMFGTWTQPAYLGHTFSDAVKTWTGNTAGPAGVASYAKTIAESMPGFTSQSKVTREVIASPGFLRLLKEQAKNEDVRAHWSEQDWQDARQDYLHHHGKHGGADYLTAPSQVPTPPSSGRGSGTRGGSDIVINHSVTYHVHGGDHQQIASLHQQHIEKLKKDIEEAQYEHNRRSFV